MAASAPVNENAKGVSGLTLIVATTLVIYNRAKIAMRGPDHATAASRGQAAPFAAAKGNIPIGPGSPNYTPSSGSATSVTGSTTAPKPTVSGDTSAYILEKKAVTGYAAATDNGKWVYLSDDDTLTLTRPAIAIPVGLTVDYVSTAIGDVFMFSFETMLAIAAGGSNKKLMPLGRYDWTTIANGNIATGIIMPHHGKFLSVFATMDAAASGAGGTAAINLELGGTNLTGGVITIATGSAAAGANVAGTAITDDGANAFSEGDLLDIECAGTGGTRTTGSFNLWALYETSPGL